MKLDTGDKKNLKSVWLWIKYVMLPVAVAYLIYGDVMFSVLYDNPAIILIFLAAFFGSTMDTLDHHFHISIFSKLKPIWWNPEISWANKYANVKWNGKAMFQDGEFLKPRKLFWKINYPVQITDAWHLVKTLMLVCWLSAYVLYKPVNGYLWDLLIAGVVYNSYFSLFYNEIFIRKQPKPL